MANHYSPKRQALIDMKEEGLDVSVIERTQVIFCEEQLMIIKEGIIITY